MFTKKKAQVKAEPQTTEEEAVASYNKGDILPITEVVGYQVVKEILPNGQANVVPVEKRWEAELLSIAFKA